MIISHNLRYSLLFILLYSIIMYVYQVYLLFLLPSSMELVKKIILFHFSLNGGGGGSEFSEVGRFKKKITIALLTYQR